jgi:peptide deformylase
MFVFRTPRSHLAAQGIIEDLNNPHFTVAINPKIESASKDTILGMEGCLSLPDFRTLVRRPARIDVSFLNDRGEQSTGTYRGLPGRCFQHELDHLNGVLEIDREEQFLDEAEAEEAWGAAVEMHIRNLKKFYGIEVEWEDDEDGEGGAQSVA